eukprot:TRINITY_DN21381_c0_g2_i1.p1 TRINITY_DN21381_c0_g2~~TRINITY_DN21381_c0_g2_i1.p1  ORF type:complete len:941 (-),score=202.40 TRINITY_DN21381_c0_g2_i1:47-2869(-)
MSFLDVWNNSAAFIQSFFSWGTFNRDAYVDNVACRQAQSYQKKNYHLSWITIARDDIRSMMGISVNRINNYMIVATLIMGVAASAVVSIRFSPLVPDYVVYAYYLSTGICTIFLMLSIMFGVKGQNAAFTNTMKLLTFKVRPENPAEYSHDYMKQAQYIEALGPTEMFRIPGLDANYDTDRYEEANWKLESGKAAGLKGMGDQKNKQRRFGPVAEDKTPLESFEVTGQYTWYLAKFARFMKLWLPYDTYSKYSMGLGIIALGQASAYFVMGLLVGEKGRSLPYWAAVVLTTSFLYLVVMVTVQNFTPRNLASKATVYGLLMGGPLSLVIAATTRHRYVESIFVTLAYFSHTIFWLTVFLLAQKDMTDPKLEFSEEGRLDFWNTSRKTRRAFERGGLMHHEEDPYPDSKYPQSTTYGHMAQDPTAAAYQSYGGQGSMAPAGAQYMAGGGGMDASYAAYAAHAHYYGGTSGGVGQDLRWQDEAYGPGDYLQDGRGAQPYDNPYNNPPPQIVGPAAALPPSETGGGLIDGEDHWPTDDREFQEKSQRLLRETKVTIRQTLFMSATLWAALLSWAVYKYVLDVRDLAEDVSNIIEMRGSIRDEPIPMAESEDVPILWPAFFRPHAVACGARGHVFLADRSHVFELQGGALTQVACDLEGTIADVTAACDTNGCWPMVLLRTTTAPSKVVSCHQRGAAGDEAGEGSNASAAANAAAAAAAAVEVQLLRQDQEPAQFVAVHSTAPSGEWRHQQLLTAHAGSVVQWKWAGDETAANAETAESASLFWEPEWFVGPVHRQLDFREAQAPQADAEAAVDPLANGAAGAEDGSAAPPHGTAGAAPASRLLSIGTSGSRMLLFYGDDPSARTGVGQSAETPAAVVEARDVWTMRRLNAWGVPAEASPILGGCAEQDGASALVIPEDNDGEPRLARLFLPAHVSTAQEEGDA